MNPLELIDFDASTPGSNCQLTDEQRLDAFDRWWNGLTIELRELYLEDERKAHG